MSRRGFLAASGALAAGVFMNQRLIALADEAEPVRLRSWKVVEFPHPNKAYRRFVKLVGDNGAVGYCRVRGGVEDIGAAVEAVRGEDLLDHERLHDLMAAKRVPLAQLKLVDIACWDLHARMLDEPLHALLGTRKKRILRYGDVRGDQPAFSPTRYARSVAAYLNRTGLEATKLHFPGAMGTDDSITFDQVVETLRAVREAVGDRKLLAWDPYPRSAESATASLDQARRIIELMDELGYAWIEGPLPPVPFETQVPKYAELLKTARLRIQAEGPRSPIGDGTPFEVMKRWVEAGAINQCSTDAYIASGVTNAIRMMEYARRHPDSKLVINLHWSWAPHAHLVMAYEDSICPTAEFPMTQDIPARCLDGPHLIAPDWPGIYCVPTR